MKKTVLLFTFCMLTTFFLPAQIPASTKPKATADTISAGTAIFLDSTVISFTICIVNPGMPAIERRCNGNILSDSSKALMKPGSIVILDNIISRRKEGGTVRLPPRKYIVR